MVARALAIVHTCIYDAWAAYHDRAVGTRFGGQLRRPQPERTLENKRRAISYAAYRAASDLFPEDKATLFNYYMVHDLGYDPMDASVDTRSPTGIGNVVCEAVLAVRHKDGSNQLGDMTSKRVPYADYTGYVPVNPASSVPVNPATVQNPDFFQPLNYSAIVRAVYPDTFVGAQWFKVKSFAGPYEDEISQVVSLFPPAVHRSEAYELQAKELVDISETLTDDHKIISEYWTDGPHSELPPGHWSLFTQFVSSRDNHNLDDDAKLFFALTNAVFDAGIAAWDLKRRFDSVRPVTAVPYVFKGKTIRSWGGPYRGTQNMDGSQWIPYQPATFPTPPFPEYPSGHSAFSSAGATMLELWTHADRFGASVTYSRGTSRIEPGLTPQGTVVLNWPTFRAAADQAGISRRYGGIHFKSGDLAGRALGRSVAERAWRMAAAYFGGR